MSLLVSSLHNTANSIYSSTSLDTLSGLILASHDRLSSQFYFHVII